MTSPMNPIREIVEAGAGCGKTTSLVARYTAAIGQNKDRELIKRYTPAANETFPEARDVLALTFTKEAASQMKERIIEALLKDGRKLEAQAVQEDSQISTYHSYCLSLIQPHLEELGYFGPLLSPEVANEFRRTDALKALADFDRKIEIRKFFKIDKLLDLSLKLLFSSNPEGFLEELSSKHQDISQRVESFFASHATQAAAINASLSEKEKGKSFSKWCEAFLAKDYDALASITLSFTKVLKEEHSDFVQEARDIKAFLKAGYSDSLSSEWQETERQAFRLLWDFVTFAETHMTKHLDFEAVEAELLQLLKSQNNLVSPPKVILIDEFQDTSPSQFEIIEAISGPSTQWYLVGDPKQSIYAFRKSDVTLFYRMREELELVGKETNYRSMPGLLKFVNQIQDQLFDPRNNPNDPPGQTLLWPKEKEDLPEQGLTHVHIFPPKHDLLKAAVENFKDAKLNGSTAFLFRSWKKLYSFAEVLRGEGIEFSISGTENPYDHILNEAFCDFLEAIDKNDFKKFDLFHARWFNAKTFNLDSPSTDTPHPQIDELSDWKQIFAQFLSSVQAERFKDHKAWVCAMERWLNAQSQNGLHTELSLSQLASFIRKRSSKFESPNPYNAGSAPRVTLLTLHASKGLEFDHVYLPELFERVSSHESQSLESEDGQFSFNLDNIDVKGKKQKSLFFEMDKLGHKNKKFSEEKRLLYVALTRAKHTMTLFAHEASAKTKVDDNPFAPVGLQSPPAPYWNRYLSDLSSNDYLSVVRHEVEEKDSGEETPNLWQQPAPFHVSRTRGREFLRMGVSQFVKIEEEERSFSSSERDFDKLPPTIKRRAEESTRLGNLFHSFIEAFDFSRDTSEQISEKLSQNSKAERDLIQFAIESLLSNDELAPLISELKLNPTNFQREFGLFLLSDTYRLTGFADLLWFKSADELCIIDWKTGSNIKRLESEERIEKFKRQLTHYAKAFSKSYKKITMMVIAIELSQTPKSKLLLNDKFQH